MVRVHERVLRSHISGTGLTRLPLRRLPGTTYQTMFDGKRWDVRVRCSFDRRDNLEHLFWLPSRAGSSAYTLQQTAYKRATIINLPWRRVMRGLCLRDWKLRIGLAPCRP